MCHLYSGSEPIKASKGEGVEVKRTLLIPYFGKITGKQTLLMKELKGIVQPFELGPVTSLVRSAVKFCEAGHFQKKFLMIQSHERSLKPISAA